VTDTTEDSSSEKDVVARINRYSQLRSVERAVRPSVRRRISLAGAGRRQDLLHRLQQLLEQVRVAHGSDRGQAGERAEMASLDAELDDLARELANTVRRMPLAHFRATLPVVVAAHRNDAVALLDFWLETLDWKADPLYLVEYLITLLATEVVDGHTSLVCDPASVSAGVERACERQAAEGDEGRVREAASLLRRTSMHVLAEDDLEDTIVAMRAVKANARGCFFDRDLLRSIVQYNTTVKNRFAALESAVSDRRGVVERTLAALRALDPPESVALGAV
jgi:hypothetical protein